MTQMELDGTDEVASPASRVVVICAICTHLCHLW
jgi:hypothetical protein